MLQVVLNAFHFGMDIQEAIDAPRFITMNFPNSFAPYNHYPGLLGLERRFSSTTHDELLTLGHKIEEFPAYSRRLAAVEAVLYEPPTGFFRSGADPRQPAYAITV
jgi:gamma-glutamyltranspeptidase/glutathione hydrolase